MESKEKVVAAISAAIESYLAWEQADFSTRPRPTLRRWVRLGRQELMHQRVSCQLRKFRR